MPDLRIWLAVAPTFTPDANRQNFTARAVETDPVSYVPDESLIPGALAASGTPTSSAASSTSDEPFFPAPTKTAECDGCDATATKSLEYTKNAVEGALIVVAFALVSAFFIWRIIRLRRKNRPLRDFFRAHHCSHPSVPSRPSNVPRTTGLPPTRGPPASVIYDTLAPPVPLMHRDDTLRYGQRRGRGRRTRAGDIDAGGRRGPIVHPEDPDEELPVYDDKDVLPRYQDLEAGAASGQVVGIRDDLGRMPEDAGRMVGVGAIGRSPNGNGGTGDTDPLVTEMRLNGTSEDGHTYPPPMSSAESHEGHEEARRPT